MLVRKAGAIRPFLVAAALLFFSIPTYYLFFSGKPDWKSKSTAWLPNLGQTNVGEFISPSEPATTSEQPSSQNAPPGLVADAHKLPAADAFLSHFKSITQMKAMTVGKAKSTCTWNKSEEVNFQFGEDAGWAQKDRDDEEIEFRTQQWHKFVNDEMLPYESYKDRFEGRGIIIVAGNEKSLKRVRAMLRQLKRIGSQLPIEFHYFGDEFSLDSQKEIASMWHTVYFNDLSAASNVVKTSNDNIFHVNYQLKTAAVLNARFAEVLLLDSDNIPIVDPESLFESDVYKEFGTLFWPDIARSRPQNPMWAITNTNCRMNEYEQESGQLLVDKRKFFYHLQLAAWFNNVHTAYYYEFLLGDKDMFRFAWHALKTRYGFPPKWVTSVGTVSPDGLYCGHSFAQHHPNGSVAFLHGGLLKTIPKAVMKWHIENKGGIFQVYKRSIVDEQHHFTERVGIKMDGSMWLPNRPEDLAAEWCTDIWDVHPRKLDEIVPGFQKTFEEIGGYWALEDPDHT